MIEVDTKTRDIPVWLTGVVLVLCVAGGVWMVRWYTRQEAKQTVEVPLEDPATAAASAAFRSTIAAPGAPGAGPRSTRAAAGQQLPEGVDGVRTLGSRGNTWIVRAGDATMYVSLGRNGQPELSPSYVTQKLTPEQSQVLMMRRRLLADASARDLVKLTPAQLEALRKVDDFRGMIVEPADKARLATLFQAWRDASSDKAPQEKALVAALAEISKRAAGPTQAFDSGRVEQVRKVLTPEQVQTFNGALAPPGSAPAPAPPPAPAAGQKPTARSAAPPSVPAAA